MAHFQKLQYNGIISLLPKGSKPKEFLRNWHPITLLFVGYKLISGCIDQSLSSVISNIVNKDQCGFIKGRYIGENVRLTYNVLDWAKTKKRTGLVLLLDFEKAFDSISFVCITKTLSFFGFEPDVIKWVDILLNNFRASLSHAGNLSDFFDILRGCRQGDPIASLLFIMVVELLAIKLRNSTDIKGYKIDSMIALLSLYADDATIFLEYNADTLRATVAILENFLKLSGLKIQLVIVFGNLPDGDYRLCPDIPIEWKQDFKLLGIMFDPFLEKMNQNFDIKIDNIKETICSWKNLTEC